MLWLDRFLSCLDSLIENKPDNITYSISVIYGDSNDGTDLEVKKRMSELRKKYKCEIKMACLPLPRRLDVLEKLGILRNVSITMFNTKKFDHVLHMDTDIVFHYDDIEKLIRDIDSNNDIGIIAPLIYIESSKTFYDTFAFRMNKKMFRADLSNIKKDNIISVDEIFEVDSVGTLYICRSDIFWKYNIKYWTELREADESDIHPHKKYESEQVVFCSNVKEITRYKVMVDHSIRIDHVDLEKYGKSWH